MRSALRVQIAALILALGLGTAAVATAERIGGTRGADSLGGTRKGDTLRGRGGDDVLRGRAGRDRAFGGPGADSLVGGPGGDTLTGGAGEDEFNAVAGVGRGAGGNDRIKARDGSEDLVNCGRGRDVAVVDASEDGLFDCEVVREP